MRKILVLLVALMFVGHIVSADMVIKEGNMSKEELLERHNIKEEDMGDIESEEVNVEMDGAEGTDEPDRSGAGGYGLLDLVVSSVISFVVGTALTFFTIKLKNRRKDEEIKL